MLFSDNRSDAYIDDSSLLTDWWGWRLVYRPAGVGAPDVEPVLYLWPPGRPGQPEDAPHRVTTARSDWGIAGQPIGPRDLAYAARRARVGRAPILLEWRHDLIIAVRVYAAMRRGRYPRHLGDLLDGGYVSEKLLRGLRSEGFRYVSPQADDGDEVLGCHWPPEGAETTVFFMDGDVDSAEVEVELVNPRTGAAQHVVLEEHALREPVAPEVGGSAP
jgi:hypothetical protein